MQSWEVKSRQAGQLLADFNGISMSAEGHRIAHFTTHEGKRQALDPPSLQIMARTLHEEMKKNPDNPWPQGQEAAHNHEIDLLHESLFLMILQRDGYLSEQLSSSAPSASYKEAGRFTRQILSRHTLKGELR